MPLWNYDYLTNPPTPAKNLHFQLVIDYPKSDRFYCQAGGGFFGVNPVRWGCGA
jgi:hypothetical protein